MIFQKMRKILDNKGDCHKRSLFYSEGSSGSSNSDSSSDDQKVTGKNGGPGVKKDSANTGNSSEITIGQAPG